MLSEPQLIDFMTAFSAELPAVSGMEVSRADTHTHTHTHTRGMHDSCRRLAGDKCFRIAGAQKQRMEEMCVHVCVSVCVHSPRSVSTTLA